MNYANVNLVYTKDGSFSFVSNDINQSYHSLNGAFSESKYVFIENGLDFLINNIINNSSQLSIIQINILEVGLGSFLNFFQTINFLSELNTNFTLKLNYVGLEPLPIKENILLDEYIKIFNYKDKNTSKHSVIIPKIEIIEKVINSKWDISHNLEVGRLIINYTKLNEKLENYLEQSKINLGFDLVYFDAFSKSAQSNLWDFDYLEKLYKIMKPHSLFVTYASNSQLKKDLAKLGFELNILKGALGKREMIRALKI